MTQKDTYFIPKEYKKTEEVSYLNTETPSYREFLENYRPDELVERSYQDEINANVELGKGYGPMYSSSRSNSNSHTMIYDLSRASSSGRYFFKIKGEHYKKWTLSGNLDELQDELWKLENGEIEIIHISNSDGVHERDRNQEDTVRRALRKSIRELQEAERLGRVNSGLTLRFEELA